MSNRRDFLRAGGCFLFAFANLPVFEVLADGGPTEKRFPLPAADSVNVDRGSQTILVRYQGNIFAFALACPHEHAAVKWLPKDHRFQCTKHDSQYQPNGTYTAGRATRNLDRFTVRREDTMIVVDLTHWFESDKDPSGWVSAVVQV
jgi:nitrite reductase/ring-hydroxylating ferredoxin subunit